MTLLRWPSSTCYLPSAVTPASEIQPNFQTPRSLTSGSGARASGRGTLSQQRVLGSLPRKPWSFRGQRPGQLSQTEQSACVLQGMHTPESVWNGKAVYQALRGQAVLNKGATQIKSASPGPTAGNWVLSLWLCRVTKQTHKQN